MYIILADFFKDDELIENDFEVLIDTAESRSEAQEVIEEDIKYQSTDEANKITYAAVKATEEEYLNDTFSTWTNQLTTYIVKDRKFELK